jgi:hypothetical protein
MQPKAKKLSGAAAHSATRSIQAAKINSTCRLFLRRVKAAKSRCTEELKNLQSPSARQRVQTEYEATLTNLHLALDKELDGIWAEFGENVQEILLPERLKPWNVLSVLKRHAILLVATVLGLPVSDDVRYG